MKKRKKLLSIAVYPLIIVSLILYVMGIYNCNLYESEKKSAIEITAIVTKHKQVSDDWHSYITYSLNGIKYKNIEFEGKTSRSDLTPVNSTITITISPNYPDRLLDDIMYVAKACINTGSILLFPTFFYPMTGTKGEGTYCFPLSDELIRFHLQKRVKNNTKRIFLPLFWFVLYTFLILLFPDMFGAFMPVACIIISLLLTLNYLRNISRCKSDSYYIVKETIESKYINIDDRGDTTTKSNKLCFFSTEENLETEVDEIIYPLVKKGDVFYCVYYKEKDQSKKRLLGFRQSADELIVYFV